jgi:cytochrome c2
MTNASRRPISTAKGTCDMSNTARKAPLLACAAAALALVSAAACGAAATESPSPGSEAAAAKPATPAAGGLTPFELEHGIGPITAPLKLGSGVDAAMAASGAKVFEQKCAPCHKMGERYVGPQLGDVLTRRSPTFVMNMALNPLGMVEKHPVTKKLLAEYFIAMPNQNISPDEARQVLEYLRTQAH